MSSTSVRANAAGVPPTAVANVAGAGATQRPAPLQSRPSAAQLRSQQRVWLVWSSRHWAPLAHCEVVPQGVPMGRSSLQTPVRVLQPLPQSALVSHWTQPLPSLRQNGVLPAQGWAQQIWVALPTVGSQLFVVHSAPLPLHGWRKVSRQSPRVAVHWRPLVQSGSGWPAPTATQRPVLGAQRSHAPLQASWQHTPSVQVEPAWHC